MQIFLCVVIALAVFQSATCRSPFDDSSELDQPFLPGRLMTAKEKNEALREMLKQYKRNSAMQELKDKAEDYCPGYGDKFVNATLKAANCLEIVDETQETTCSLVQNHLSKCMQPAIDVLEECVPPKSRELPSMILKAIINIVSKLCKTDGEHIFELGNPCVMSKNHRTESCIRRVRARAQQYARNTPSVVEVCEFLGSLKPCVQSHLDASCGNQKTRESFMDLFNAGMRACDAVNTNVIEGVSSSEGEYEIVDVQ